MKWLVADVDWGVTDVAKTKREATEILTNQFDNKIRSHKMTAGLYRYDVFIGGVWIETGKYIVREYHLKLWNPAMWNAWKLKMDYRGYKSLDGSEY
jgi:hypothetical protein